MSLFGNKQRRALVLGCGPAGMFATHALVESGWSVIVMSKKRRSHMFGAQYLHMPIPGLPERPFEVDYQLRGSIEEYTRKVYNGKSVPFASPDRLIGKRMGWDIRAAYANAYDRYAAHIIDTGPITNDWARQFINPALYDLIFTTIPATALCGDPKHKFESQKVYAIGDAPDKGVFVPPVCPDNTVICNGESAPAWYRAARILGYGTMEWPGSKKPPIKEVSEVTKPIATDCDCFKGGAGRPWYRLGRYGTWTKGMLSHDAYYNTIDIIKSR